MGSALRTNQPHEALPPEIYLPLVDSLFKEGRTLFAGTILGAGSIFITYWKTGEALLLYCAIAVLLVAALRGLVMRAYQRARPAIKTVEAARRWEHIYVAGAATSIALLGLWCYLAFARTSDPFTQLVSFSMTIAYTTGIFGRNFGSARFVVVQIFCAWAPITAALLIYGNIFHWIFAGLLVPAFLALKFIADRLRSTLLDAVVSSRDMSLLAKRFDTAINNMPHGLCMFDSKRRVVVSNGKLKQQLGLASDLELKGLCVREVVEAIIKAGLLSETGAQSMIDHLDARLAGGDDSAFALDLMNGRTLEFTVQPMENGGMVVLIEDITERKIAEAKINHLARFDALTGLPNRVVLRDRMERALNEWRADNMCAIHFIDLDQFKQVNDTLGHTRGDMLLEAVAERLKNAIRDADVISRFGGDEFVILRRRSNRSSKAKRWRRACSMPWPVRTTSTATRSSSPPASALRSPRAGSIRSNCCATPTSRSIRRRPTAAALSAGSRPRWKQAPRRAVRSNWICAARPRAKPSSSIISRSSISRRGASKPARRCCAGRITSAAWSRRPSSSRSPRKWA
jgi:diguanylate cyclase (GGDEF)-like protein